MRTALGTFLVVLAACTRVSPVPPGQDADVQKVSEEALAGFVDSWNRAAAGDSIAPARYGTLYWTDAELVDPSGLIWNGQPAIVQMHVDLWNTSFKGSQIKGSVRRVRPLSPTLMIADFDLELALFKEGLSGNREANGVIKAHLKHVMEKRAGEWKVIAAQNTFFSDARPGI